MNDIASDDGTQPPFDESRLPELTEEYMDSLSMNVPKLEDLTNLATHWIHCYENDPEKRDMRDNVLVLKFVSEDRIKRAKASEDDLTMEHLDSISNSVFLLEGFTHITTYFIQCYENDPAKRDKLRDVIRLNALSEDRLKQAMKNAKRKIDLEAARVENRIKNFEYRMDAPYRGSHDLTRFTQRVMDLFRWHQSPGTERNKKPCIAPYFPLIQSSGMGKTRLMLEFKKSAATSDMKVVLILCVYPWTTYDISKGSIYDEILIVPRELTNESKTELLERLTQTKMNAMKEHKKVVFLLDEADQFFDGVEAHPFRCFRWWLCEYGNTEERAVVAVLAGTTTELATLYPEHQGATSSREVSCHYTFENKLYEPFFDLTTMGCLNDQAKDSFETEFEKAIPYGRPLFTLLHEQYPLTDNNVLMESILKKMLLGERYWEHHPMACLSILATRVQMGQLSTPIVSALVNKSYCNLTGYKRLQSGGEDIDVNFCYFTDPVCAHLAMRLMVSDTAEAINYFGQNPTSWTNRVTKIFAICMCRPNNDNVGVVAVELYLLFCGDILRKHKDARLFTFSVNLDSFLSLLMEPSRLNHQVMTTNTDTVSFIQFSKCHLRLPLDKMLTQAFLKHIYESATACCLHDGFPAIDFVASIRKSDGTFSVMCVTIKAQESFGNSSILDLRRDMESVSENLPNNLKPLYLICLVGREERDDLPPDTSNHKTIEIPQDDPFGVTDMFVMSTAENEIPEIYSSHHLLAPLHDLQPAEVLRKNRKKPWTGREEVDSVDYLQNVLSDFSKQEETPLEE